MESVFIASSKVLLCQNRRHTIDDFDNAFLMTWSTGNYVLHKTRRMEASNTNGNYKQVDGSYYTLQIAVTL